MPAALASDISLHQLVVQPLWLHPFVEALVDLSHSSSPHAILTELGLRDARKFFFTMSRISSVT